MCTKTAFLKDDVHRDAKDEVTSKHWGALARVTNAEQNYALCEFWSVPVGNSNSALKNTPPEDWAYSKGVICFYFIALLTASSRYAQNRTRNQNRAEIKRQYDESRFY